MIYHESLVQPAMTMHPNPKRVFIGGGGEGATLREVLKHESVELCVMCDLDEKVVKLCAEHLVPHHRGALTPGCPRVELAFQDAKKYLEQSEGLWDVIILDLCDPVECGPAFQLYTKEFYKFCMDKLGPNGVFVTQSGPMSITSHNVVFTPINRTLRDVFPHVAAYGSHVPSFGHEWGFNVACKTQDEFALVTAEPDVVDRKVAAKVKPGDFGPLRFYDGITNRRLFSLSKITREALEKETRVASESDPMIFNAGLGKAVEKQA